MRSEDGDSPPEEKDARLKWMDITFTDVSGMSFLRGRTKKGLALDGEPDTS